MAQPAQPASQIASTTTSETTQHPLLPRAFQHLLSLSCLSADSLSSDHDLILSLTACTAFFSYRLEARNTGHLGAR